MTYRTERLGWHGHALEMFALAVVLFWVVVLVAYRRSEQRTTS